MASVAVSSPEKLKVTPINLRTLQNEILSQRGNKRSQRQITKSSSKESNNKNSKRSNAADSKRTSSHPSMRRRLSAEDRGSQLIITDQGDNDTIRLTKIKK